MGAMSLQVRFYSRVAFQLGLLGLGMVCVYFTAKELFPGRLGAQSLFSEAFDRIRNHEEVMVMAGHDMKAFGRDVGRNEGRRNHVDSYSYKAEDGSNRTRIRFNVKGDKGKVIVWVEVSFSTLCLLLNILLLRWRVLFDAFEDSGASPARFG